MGIVFFLWRRDAFTEWAAIGQADGAAGHDARSKLSNVQIELIPPSGCAKLASRGNMDTKTPSTTHLTDAERIDRLRLIRSDNVGPRGIMAQTPQEI
jgi:hypothetical protein